MIPKQLKHTYQDLFPDIAIGNMGADDQHGSLKFELLKALQPKLQAKPQTASSSYNEPEFNANLRELGSIMKNALQKKQI